MLTGGMCVLWSYHDLTFADDCRIVHYVYSLRENFEEAAKTPQIRAARLIWGCERSATASASRRDAQRGTRESSKTLCGARSAKLRDKNVPKKRAKPRSRAGTQWR